MIVVSLVALLPTTWIVDAASGPGTHFVDLPAAVAAAQTGDTLLVRAGSYSGFQLVGKSLTIRGAGAAVTHCGEIDIAATVPGQPCYLSGLGIDRSLQVTQQLFVHTDAVVTIADCRVAPPSVSFIVNVPAAQVEGELHAIRCSFRAGNGYLTSAVGVFVLGGRFAAQDCSLQGGTVLLTASSGGFAGDGLLCAAGASASLAWTDCIGGDVDASLLTRPPQFVAQTGIGIHAINQSFVRIAGDAATRVDSGLRFPGWSGITVSNGMTTDGSSQVVVHGAVGVRGGTSGSVAFVAAQPRITWTGTVLASGELDATQPTTLSILGTPGAVCAFSIDVAPTYLANVAPWMVGELVVLPNAGTSFGVLDAAGQFAVTATVQSVAPLLRGLPITAQGATLGATDVLLTGGIVRLFD